MRPIRPGMPGGPRMPVGQGVGKPAGMAPGMPSGPRMPIAQGVGSPVGMGAGTQVYAPRSGNVPVKPPPPGMRMKKGGSASSRADGIAKRGKTKGKII